MRKIFVAISILLLMPIFASARIKYCLLTAENATNLENKSNADAEYPSIEIKNSKAKMTLYLPDAENGYYRGTRFDWSGIISSFNYIGHEFFGEWNETHNPFNSSDITGPVNGFLLPGLGYETAKAGEGFIRIGVGVLEKENEESYQPFKTYKIIDNGEWKIDYGDDWIEFKHKLNSGSKWGYIYKKRIDLIKDKPGFKISYYLKNTGEELIETDQFNHNFFLIDNTKPGPDYYLEFPFSCSVQNNQMAKNSPVVLVENNRLRFQSEVTDRDVWMKIGGFGSITSENQFTLRNVKTGAEISVKGNIPLYDLIFWANKKVLSPETFIYLKIPPGKFMKWEFTYTVASLN